MRVRGQELDVAPDNYVQQLTEAFARRLTERAKAWEAHQVTAPPVEEIVDLYTDLLPAADFALDAEIGPFYDTTNAATILGGITKQAVASRRANGSILAVQSAEGRWAYPTFQFAGGDVDARLLPAIQALRGCPRWSVALWFVTPNDDLGEATPLQWARTLERPLEPMVTSAAHTARAWA